MCFYNLPTNPNLKLRILATTARALLLCIHNGRCCKEYSRALFRDDGPSIFSQVLKGLHTLIIDLDLWRLEVSGCKVRRLQFQDKWGAFIYMRLQTKLHWCMCAVSPCGLSKQGQCWNSETLKKCTINCPVDSIILNHPVWLDLKIHRSWLVIAQCLHWLWLLQWPVLVTLWKVLVPVEIHTEPLSSSNYLSWLPTDYHQLKEIVFTIMHGNWL